MQEGSEQIISSIGHSNKLLLTSVYHSYERNIEWTIIIHYWSLVNVCSVLTSLIKIQPAKAERRDLT